MFVFLRIILILLALFLPFAFAGAEPWAFSVLQGGVVLVWLLYWLTYRESAAYTRLAKIAVCTAAFLILLSLLQACFPRTILQPAVWFPVSHMPLYSLEFASMLATYTLVMILAGFLFPQQKSIQLFLGILVGISAAVSLCAWGMPHGEYIFRLAEVRGGIGPFLNRNHAAVFFAMSAVLSLGLFFTSLHRKQTAPAEKAPRLSVYPILWGGLCLFLTFSTIMTRSRGGMLALLVGLFLYAYLYLATLKRHPSTRKRGLLATTLILLLTVIWISTHIPLINAFAQRTDNTSTQIRQMLYQAAADTGRHYPLWGIGAGALPVVIPAYTAYPLEQYIERLHNDWLELLISVGILGCLPIVLGILCFGWRAIKQLQVLPSHKRPLFTACLSALAVMSVGSAVDFHFFIPANAFLFFLCVGILASPTYDKYHLRPLPLPRLSGWLVALISLSILYIPMCKTLAWRNVLFSRGLRPPAKLALYREALAYYPSPRYAVRLGNACLNEAAHTSSQEERAALEQEALSVAVRYLRRYPKEPELSLLYVRSQAGKHSL